MSSMIDPNCEDDNDELSFRGVVFAIVVTAICAGLKCLFSYFI